MKKGCVVKSAFLKLELSIQGDLRSRVCDRQKVKNIVICKFLQQNVNKRVRKIELSNFDAVNFEKLLFHRLNASRYIAFKRST